MKKRIVSLIMCVMLLIGATLTVSACGTGDLVKYEKGVSYVVSEKGEALPYYATTYDIMGGSDVMPVGGFLGLYRSGAGGSEDGNSLPDLSGEDQFILSKQAGINMVVYTYDRVEGADYKRWFELGEKYGIGIFASSNEFEGKVGSRTTDGIGLGTTEYPTKEWMYNKIKKVSYDFQYKSFLGLWAMDEIYANHQLKNMKILSDIWAECDFPEGIDLYSNSLGYWEGLNNVSNTFTGGGWTFHQYMHTGKSGTNNDGSQWYIPPYFSLGFKMLSSTQYPVTSAETNYDEFTNWFQNLSFLLDEAEAQHIPYWRMMQAGGEFGAYPAKDHYPLEGQFMLDYNSSLAFGCKGMQYYMLHTDKGQSTVRPKNTNGSEDYYDYGKNGLIGIDGKPNDWWYYACNADKELKAIDHVLMHSAAVGILPHGKQATALIGPLTGERLITTKGFRQLKKISGDDCFVGCFDYKGGTALYVVNSNSEEKADVSLNFDDKYRYDVTQRGDTVSVVGTTIPLTLAPGEGAMVVLY